MHAFSSSAPLLRLESLLSQAELNALLYGQWPDHPDHLDQPAHPVQMLPVFQNTSKDLYDLPHA